MPPALLTTAFYAFYDLHRPAYATARLPDDEARTTDAHIFDLIAGNWTTVVTAPRPSAWAWHTHTQA